MSNTMSVLAIEQPIATVDIETFGFDNNTIIIEIGVIVTTVLPMPGDIWNLAQIDILEKAGKLRAMELRPSVLEQVLYGRTFTKNTIDFHKNLHKARGVDFHEIMMSSEMDCVKVCVERLDELINHKFGKVVEVWANHPQFDFPKIKSLLSDAGVQDLPWSYKKERDVATAVATYRKSLGIGQKDLTKYQEMKNSHTGVADCCYNLAAISDSGSAGKTIAVEI